MTDPVQVVAEVRRAHWCFQNNRPGEPDMWKCSCGWAGARSAHHDHENEAIVAALKAAGLFAEEEVVGYAVVTMSLWFLTRRNDDWGYDEADGFVVRARDEQQARRMASRRAGGEGGGTWLDSARSKCEPLSVDGRPGLILRSFHHG